MRADYSIEWVPATPEYILSSIQEEWRQCGGLFGDAGEELPTFATTVKQWREAMDLVWWSPLGQALNKQWGTTFSQGEWFGVLVPAGEKTLAMCVASWRAKPAGRNSLRRNCSAMSVPRRVCFWPFGRCWFVPEHHPG